MLRVQGLTAGYGRLEAVRKLSFALHDGEILTLVGANGAGKSSTIMCLAGHVARLEGRIHVDAEDISELPADRRIHHGLAVVPEGRRLFADLCVADNLKVGGMITSRADLKRHQDDVLSLFPRLSERLSQTAGLLSGGEQQMLAIGRALMAGPRYLLIDELSLGLMPKIIDACYAVVTSLARDRGMGVILVEQYTARALEVCDHAIVLESGDVVWQGSGPEARRERAAIDAAVMGGG